jgi:hypothetical protein
MAVLAVFLLALPLMRTLSNALAEESQLRGRALLDVLAAANEAALGQGRLQDVSVSRVVHETGVTVAYVVDAESTLVAPTDDAEGGRFVSRAGRSTPSDSRDSWSSRRRMETTS